MTVYDLRTGSEISGIDLPVSVVLGNFDGLHIGHTDLIRRAKCSADKCCVFTFRENPFTAKRIMSIKTKCRILADMGVDYAAIYDFDLIRNIEWQDFIDRILIGNLKCRTAVCGFNFRFGKGAEGNSCKLKEYMESRGRECVIADPVTLDGAVVSSSRIRNLLSEGNMEEAGRLLGRPYSVDYSVTHGNGIGRSLGFPTINQSYDPKDIKLPYGVYICSCLGYPAITNFGVRPTVTDKNEPFYETFIIGYEGDLYGRDVRVDFYSKIRAEKKFSTFEELSRQIALDVEKAKEFFT